jgi:small redox-active disulfide protein 2
MAVQIEVLGPGCDRCRTLYENAKSAVEALGVEADVRKIDDPAEMARRGIWASPALVVNGELVLAGHVATPRRVGELIGAAI